MVLKNLNFSYKFKIIVKFFNQLCDSDIVGMSQRYLNQNLIISLT